MERKLEIRDLKITPSASIQGNETSYMVNIPNLYIDIESLWEVYRHQRLSITGVTLTKPNVTVNSVKEKTEEESVRIQLEAGELYQVISEYLRQLKIEEFDVLNGSISFSRNENHPFQVHNFNLAIEEFSMDSVNLESHKNIFYTESINLQVAQQEFELENSEKKFSFDSLIFSSRDSSFQIRNFKLYHMDSNDAEDSIAVKTLSFSGVDLNTLYNKDVIDLGPLQIESPYVHLKTTRRSKKKPKFINSSKYLIIIDSVSIKNGSVAVSNSNINLHGENIELKHGRHEILVYGPFMEPQNFINESIVSLTDISFSNPNLSLKAGILSIDGPKQELRLEKSSGEINSSKNKINYTVNEAKIIAPLFNSKNSIAFDSIWLLDPTIQIQTVPIQREQEQKERKHISVKHLSLAAGNIELQDENKKLNFDDVSGTIENFVDTLGIANLKGVNLMGSISTILDTVFISANWEYYGKRNLLVGRNLLLDQGEIDLIELSNLNIENLQNKVLEFDSLFVKGSNIEVHLEPKKAESQNELIYHKIVGLNNFIRLSSKDFLLDVDDAGFTFTKDLQLESATTKRLKFVNSKVAVQGEKLNFQPGSDTISLFAPELISASNNINADSLKILLAYDTLDIQSIGDFNSWQKQLTIYKPNVNLNLQSQDENEEPKDPVKLPIIDIKNGHLDLIISNQQQHLHLSLSDIFLKSMDEITVNNPDDWLNTKSNINHFSMTRNRKEFYAEKLQIDRKTILFDHFNSNLTSKMTIQQGRITDLNLITFQSDEPITADSIVLNEITLEIIDTIKNNSEKKMRGILSNYISTENFDFKYSSNSENLQADNINSQMNPVVIDQYTTPSKLLESNISFGLENLHFDKYSTDRLIHAGNIQYNNDDNLVEISRLKIPQKMSRDSFMLDREFQKSWMDMSAEKVSINNPDIDALLNGQGYLGNFILVDSPQLTVYGDKNLKESEAYKSILPVKMLNSSLPISLDSISINNGLIKIEQRFPEISEPAELSFSKINSTVKYIYNEKQKIEQQPNLLLFSNGNLLGDGLFRTEVKFNLTDTLGKYNMKGTVTGGNLLTLNDMLEKAGHVRVNSGINKSIEFKFKANNNYSVGEMKFIYNDLNVTILDNENRDDGFKTFVANAFVIHTKNPHFIFLRKGDIYAERKLHKEVFSQWAHSILSGAISSIGVRNNKKEIRKLNKQSQKQFAND